jgi:bifunctional UDP-N-acetylglucosamine pyrophosphorylase / glucosamine-1-phosphate N-acetyltransferase
LALAEKFLQKKIKEKIMQNGVTLVKPDLIYIEEDVKIGRDTVIEPFVKIAKGAKIGENCTITSFSNIEEGQILGNNEKTGRL